MTYWSSSCRRNPSYRRRSAALSVGTMGKGTIRAIIAMLAGGGGAGLDAVGRPVENPGTPAHWTGHDPLRLRHPAVGADRVPGWRTATRLRTAAPEVLVASPYRAGAPGILAPRGPSRHGLAGEDGRSRSLLRAPAHLRWNQLQDSRNATAVGGAHLERGGGHRQRGHAGEPTFAGSVGTDGGAETPHRGPQAPPHDVRGSPDAACGCDPHPAAHRAGGERRRRVRLRRAGLAHRGRDARADWGASSPAGVAVSGEASARLGCDSWAGAASCCSHDVGNVTVIVVPAPAAVCMSKVPPPTMARSRIMVSP